MLPINLLTGGLIVVLRPELSHLLPKLAGISARIEWMPALTTHHPQECVCKTSFLSIAMASGWCPSWRISTGHGCFECRSRCTTATTWRLSPGWGIMINAPGSERILRLLGHATAEGAIRQCFPGKARNVVALGPARCVVERWPAQNRGGGWVGLPDKRRPRSGSGAEDLMSHASVATLRAAHRL